jgi:IS30 family transposase
MATDRATRWVPVEVLESQSAATAPGFLQRLRNAAPKKVHTIRTDHGTEFTDRVFATGEHLTKWDTEPRARAERLAIRPGLAVPDTFSPARV